MNRMRSHLSYPQVQSPLSCPQGHKPQWERRQASGTVPLTHGVLSPGRDSSSAAYGDVAEVRLAGFKVSQVT